MAAVLPNEADIVFAFHGAMRLGAIWVGINQALAPPEKAFLLADSRASAPPVRCGHGRRSPPARAELSDLGQVVVEDAWREADGAWPRPSATSRPSIPDAPAALAYTSGTTGRPKGAVHSQRNLLAARRGAGPRRRGYGPDLRKGDCLPLTILNMMVLTTLLVAQAGGTTVIMDQLDAEGVAGVDRARAGDGVERPAPRPPQPRAARRRRPPSPGHPARGVVGRRRPARGAAGPVRSRCSASP